MNKITKKQAELLGRREYHYLENRINDAKRRIKEAEEALKYAKQELKRIEKDASEAGQKLWDSGSEFYIDSLLVALEKEIIGDEDTYLGFRISCDFYPEDYAFQCFSVYDDQFNFLFCDFDAKTLDQLKQKIDQYAAKNNN